MEALEVTGMTRELAQHCTLGDRDERQIRLVLDPRRQQLLTPRLQQGLEKALRRYFGGSQKLRIDVGKEPAVTPAARRAGREAERQAQAREAIEQDPHVAALRDAFDAQVIPETVRPQDAPREE